MRNQQLCQTSTLGNDRGGSGPAGKQAAPSRRGGLGRGIRNLDGRLGLGSGRGWLDGSLGLGCLGGSLGGRLGLGCGRGRRNESRHGHGIQPGQKGNVLIQTQIGDDRQRCATGLHHAATNVGAIRGIALPLIANVARFALLAVNVGGRARAQDARHFGRQGGQGTTCGDGAARLVRTPNGRRRRLDFALGIGNGKAGWHQSSAHIDANARHGSPIVGGVKAAKLEGDAQTEQIELTGNGRCRAVAIVRQAQFVKALAAKFQGRGKGASALQVARQDLVEEQTSHGQELLRLSLTLTTVATQTFVKTLDNGVLKLLSQGTDHWIRFRFLMNLALSSPHNTE
jgi:hypothetical protein